MNTRAIGQNGEDQALAHLCANGLTLVQRNYRTPGRRGNEIDLIMRECTGEQTLVFVEVRARSNNRYGGAAASVGAVKKRRIIQAARYYLLAYPVMPPCRFDVISLGDNVLNAIGVAQKEQAHSWLSKQPKKQRHFAVLPNGHFHVLRRASIHHNEHKIQQ